jgi:hypothetical protein
MPIFLERSRNKAPEIITNIGTLHLTSERNTQQKSHPTEGKLSYHIRPGVCRQTTAKAANILKASNVIMRLF